MKTKEIWSFGISRIVSLCADHYSKAILMRMRHMRTVLVRQTQSRTAREAGPGRRAPESQTVSEPPRARIGFMAKALCRLYEAELSAVSNSYALKSIFAADGMNSR
jgi:hypothetical protein